MPFTLLHLGPALILGYLLRRRIHWPTLIVTSVVVDLEPLVVILFDLDNYPVHGYLHTFASSILFGSLVGVAMWLLRKYFSNLFSLLALATTSYSLSNYVVAGFSGWFLHVLLDSPLYSDIRPFYPLNTNPLYCPNISGLVVKSCLCLTFVGILTYLLHFYKTRKFLFKYHHTRYALVSFRCLKTL